MKSDNFKAYSKYYDLLYSNKNYEAEVKYIDKLVKKYSPNAVDVLEFGSGTGKHGILLSAMGYEVFGIERSEEMVEKARESSFPCIAGDLTSTVLNKKYDVVLSLFHVISYLNDNSSLIAAFKNAHLHLKKDGIFIFDVWYTPSVRQVKPEARVKEVENTSIKVIRFANPEVKSQENVINVNYTVLVNDKTTGSWDELTEVHPMRHFCIPEIDLLCKMNGFVILKTEEFISGNEPSDLTWAVNFIVKKNE